MAFSDEFDGKPLNELKRSLGLDKPSQGKRIRELTRYVKENKAERVATFGGLHVFPDRIIKLPNPEAGFAGMVEEVDERPVGGVTAVLEQTGDVQSRGTLTRSFVLSGWQKRDDQRKWHLIVSGPDGWRWSVLVPKRLAERAGKFAVELTTFGYDAAAE